MRVDATMLPSGKRVKNKKFEKGKNTISRGNFTITTDKDLSPEGKAMVVRQVTMMFNMLDQSIINKELLSDLNTLYDDNPLDIDGSILIRMSNKAKGLLRASQIATGDENNITVAIYGKKGALKWEQENPNYLYFLKDDEINRDK